MYVTPQGDKIFVVDGHIHLWEPGRRTGATATASPSSRVSGARTSA